MDKSLYDIRADYAAVIAEAEEALENGNFDLIESLNEKMQISREEFDEKGEAYVKVIRMIKARIDYLKKFKADEVKRIDDAIKTEQNKLKTMQNMLLSALELFGFRQYSFKHFKIFTRVAAPKLVISSVRALPENLKKEKYKLVIDEQAIIDLLLAGQEVPGARLDEVVETVADEPALKEALLEQEALLAQSKEEGAEPIDPKSLIVGAQLERTVSLMIK